MHKISIFDDIGDGFFGGGVTAKGVDNQLRAIDGDLTVQINSYGGDVFEGLAIYNLLSGYERGRVDVEVLGIAASAASIIAMAGENIAVADNGMVMIHDPWMQVAGNADDFRARADELDQIKESLVNTYAKRATVDSETIAEMMRDETWLSAEQAIGIGLATGTITREASSVAQNRARPWIRNDVTAHMASPVADADQLLINSYRRRMLDTTMRDSQLFGV